jgi:hypothetical protein|tara:strand:- start:424 stop:687 length:264 start_codon:yes stop_codon:yes gene_type:complete
MAVENEKIIGEYEFSIDELDLEELGSCLSKIKTTAREIHNEFSTSESPSILLEELKCLSGHVLKLSLKLKTTQKRLMRDRLNIDDEE